MTNEKALLDQIRKKHLAPLIGTSIALITILLAIIFAASSRAGNNLFEIIIGIVLVVLLFGSGVFIELYQFLNPQKDIFFRKYGKPSEAVKLVNEALSEQKLYSDEKIVITENYIFAPNKYETLVKISDVLLAFESYSQDGKKEYAAVDIIDTWGIEQLFKYKIDDTCNVREAIAVIRENFPNIKVASDENAFLYAQSRIKKLPEN